MISLYDTHLKAKVSLRPLGQRVGIYACGPTVHDAPHLGNARSAVAFDVLRRVVQRVHGDVLHVRNITDIDDKIIIKAHQQGVGIEEVTSKATALWHDAMSLLHVLEPHVEPRATEHVADMIAMIGRLLWSGHAYQASDHVLFSASMGLGEGFLTGQHSGRQAGHRVPERSSTNKRSPADFVLWKPALPQEPGWESPWGRGRPGWHIECSAMSARYLGDHFDIHAGGADLMAPHHENEMSQSCAAHGGTVMATHWMHNGMLTVDGKKMSKSLGNFVTVQQAVNGSTPRALALRFLILSTHYRGELDYSQARLNDAEATLARFHARLTGVDPVGFDDEVEGFLHDDLNVPGALSRLHQLVSEKSIRSLQAAAAAMLLLGLESGDEASRVQTPLDAEAALILEKRASARASRDWAEADRLRKVLENQHGILLKDTASGTSWEKMA